MYVTLDIAKESETAFRQLCQDQRFIEILHYERTGPGGGNPRFRLLVDGYGAHLALINFYYGK